MSNEIGMIKALNPSGAPILKKPPYLVTLLEAPVGKKDATKIRFISLDKPESINGFVQVKGIYSEELEEDIIKTFSNILSETPKDQILEMMFPLHRIHSIRSLVFNAVKTTTPVNKQQE